MATTSFKRPKYGFVKPVKTRKAKLKKPDLRELARYYKAVATYGMWNQIDNMCFAMHWWEDFLKWYDEAIGKEHRTTAQAKHLQHALSARLRGIKAQTEKQKILMFSGAMLSFEKLAKLVDIKVPAFAPYIKQGDIAAAKNKAILVKMEPRFERITSLLSAMFSSCQLSIVVVPQIIDATGKEIGRKLDHTKDTIYYSRKMMKALRTRLRKEGYLAIALEEAYWLARGMSIVDQRVDTVKHFENYMKLLDNFNHWASKKDTPTRLVRKPTKVKKMKKPIDVEAVEEKLKTAEILSIEHMPSSRLTVAAPGDYPEGYADYGRGRRE